MRSAAGEVVLLEKAVEVTDNVEVWLFALAEEMKSTLRGTFCFLVLSNLQFNLENACNLSTRAHSLVKYYPCQMLFCSQTNAKLL